MFCQKGKMAFDLKCASFSKINYRPAFFVSTKRKILAQISRFLYSLAAFGHRLKQSKAEALTRNIQFMYNQSGSAKGKCQMSTELLNPVETVFFSFLVDLFCSH